MPPIKKIKPNEDELIALIKEQLINHKEAYVPGSWEDFNKKEDKRRGLAFWIGSLSGVAAALLIGVAVYFTLDTKSLSIPDKTSGQDKSSQVTTESKKAGSLIDPEQHDVLAHSANTRSTGQNGVQPVTAIDKNRHAEQISMVSVKEDSILKASSVKESLAWKNPIMEQAVVRVGTDQEVKKPSILDFLENESRINKSLSLSETKKEDAKNNNKWAMGLVVAPSIGNAKKLNMGYGVSMEYALSNKFSVNSGISYGEMSSSRNAGVNDGTMSDPSTGSIVSSDVSKSLQSTDARITGIDIPLEFKYNLSKNIYANVGVSAFAVLDQKQSNNYIQSKVQYQTALPGNNGFSTFLVNERVSENVPESEIKDPKYLGFYNFSFGYRQKLSKSNSFSVEPFMKVPMKEATTENLRLIGAGVRLKLDF
ncbi:outer membrane beta-barrel protein [Pedobacter metabolipauper]|uniref:Outer membrane protein with beta-barrel domain n=1 Tax=Pedobacter metabolipauper TaxID=425513 RepID=A0A4R6SUN2_9SPHI|nr:outer membrane beta-barrel protein [Pedobacter metabolipauper]TDQ09518.1 outer membrane protein with beta-barrel domain [Pedobacter metabolipauper]